MNRLGSILVLLCLAVSGSAAAASKDDAYLVNKRDFKKTYKVVALAPVDADPYLEMPDSVAAMLEQEVTARLQKRGYTVIPSSVLAGIRKTMEGQVGGLQHPETGEVDLAKQQAVREHAFRELWFQQQFDALATIRVTVHAVPMESDRVEWDGTKQKLTYEGRGKKYSAKVAVSSVSVAIFDSANKPLYLYYGGLEPLMYRKQEQLEPLTADRFFLDEKRIRKAAQIAVSPI
ncbi:MAG: hypothetical protein EX272_09390 [Chromatiales bacterium]|nr:MAG: hypothetical protein EX272_09390 [Chromatiales bacterium]